MDARQLKIEAARVALEHVEDGMRLGIGTGSTAEEFVRLLAVKVADWLSMVCFWDWRTRQSLPKPDTE